MPREMTKRVTQVVCEIWDGPITADGTPLQRRLCDVDMALALARVEMRYGNRVVIGDQSLWQQPVETFDHTDYNSGGVLP